MCEFAVFDYVKDKNQIPVKFNILKKAPNFIWQWYIKNFNPLCTEQLEFSFGQDRKNISVSGLDIKIPFLHDKNNFYDLTTKSAVKNCIYRTLKTLPNIKAICFKSDIANYIFADESSENPIGQFLLPDDVHDKIQKEIFIPSGRILFSFMMIDVIKKFISKTGKKLDRTEIFIIDVNHLLTKILLDNVYPHVNYLTIMTDNKKLYQAKCDEIFMDNGLNVQIVNYSKSLIKNADVIINTGAEINFEYAIKKEALYFDLSADKNDISNFKTKRPDISFFDKLFLCHNKNLFSDRYLEMILYCLSKSFANIAHGSYSTKLFQDVSAKIKDINLSISSYQK